jgi:hypothetical protein
MEKRGKSIDTRGLQQVLSGEDQSEVPNFSKALSILAQNKTLTARKIMCLDKKMYKPRGGNGVKGRFIPFMNSLYECGRKLAG